VVVVLVVVAIELVILFVGTDARKAGKAPFMILCEFASNNNAPKFDGTGWPG
jgi:hypothetical protein